MRYNFKDELKVMAAQIDDLGNHMCVRTRKYTKPELDLLNGVMKDWDTLLCIIRHSVTP